MKIEAATRIQAAETEDMEFAAVTALRKILGDKAVKFSKDDDNDYTYDIKGRHPDGYKVVGFIVVTKKGKVVDGEILLESRDGEVNIALHDLKGDRKALTQEVEDCKARISLVNTGLKLVAGL